MLLCKQTGWSHRLWEVSCSAITFFFNKESYSTHDSAHFLEWVDVIQAVLFPFLKIKILLYRGWSNTISPTGAQQYSRAVPIPTLCLSTHRILQNIACTSGFKFNMVQAMGDECSINHSVGSSLNWNEEEKEHENDTNRKKFWICPPYMFIDHSV